MHAFSFWKYNGLGNDFVIVDARSGRPHWDTAQIQAICDRHRGIGGDGVIFVEPSETGDFRMVIFNADGSRPEMCGNGLRCFVRYLVDQQLTDKHEIAVETDRGVLPCFLYRSDDGTTFDSVRVSMGAPILERSDIPMTGGPGRCIEEVLPVADTSVTITGVSMGNPHMVIFTPRIGDEARRLAPLLEAHPSYPQRTNVEFVRQHSDTHFEVLVYERGCGYTQACGTGACAVGVAAVLTERLVTDVEARVDLPGGPLWITVPADMKTVWMRGPAVPVFQGTWRA